MRTRLLALVLATTTAACAGGSAAPPAPEPPRTAPAEPSATAPLASVTPSDPAAANGNGTPDAGVPFPFAAAGSDGVTDEIGRAHV